MLASFVYYMISNNLFLLAVRRTRSKSKAVSRALILAYLIFLAKDLKDTYNSENYYKFFNVSRNFEPSVLDKNYKRLLAKSHPDRSDISIADYSKIQELHEIFGNEKNAGLVKSYRYFKADVYSDYFDRTSSKNFGYYDFEYSNHMTTNYYIVLFMQLFLLKEVKRKNNTIKILFGVFIGVCFFIEASLYGYYGLNAYTKYVVDAIESIEPFKMLTYAEIVEFVKRLIMALYFMLLVGYIEFTKDIKKIELNDILLALKDTVDKGSSTDIMKETDKLKAEREKLEKKRTSDKRTSAMLLVVLTVYGVVYALGI